MVIIIIVVLSIMLNVAQPTVVHVAAIVQAVAIPTAVIVQAAAPPAERHAAIEQ